MLGKEISNAQQRIFDHKVFVNGEIENFLNNFEVKRNDIEVEKLFHVTEAIGELKYDLAERCLALGTVNLKEISLEVNQLLNGVESFLAKTKDEKPPSDFLKQSRLKREQNKETFCLDLEHGYQRVENSFEQKEEEISELYTDLQLRLNIPK